MSKALLFLFIFASSVSLAAPVLAKEVVRTDMLVLPRPAGPGVSKLHDSLPPVVIVAPTNDPEARVWMGLQARSLSKTDQSLWTKGVVCKMSIAKDGSINKLMVFKSSDDKAKDQRVLTLLRNAAPYHPLPPSMSEQVMLVELLEFPRYKLTSSK